jgi:hypothetical protein
LDRLRHEILHLVAADGLKTHETFTRLKDIWKYRDQIVHGRVLRPEDYQRLVESLPWFRKIVGATILRVVELGVLYGGDASRAVKNPFDRLHEDIERARTESKYEAELNSRRMMDLLRPGSITIMG